MSDLVIQAAPTCQVTTNERKPGVARVATETKAGLERPIETDEADMRLNERRIIGFVAPGMT